MIRIPVICLLFLNLSVAAQDLKISYTCTDRNLSQIFKDLEKDYDLYFAYSVDEVRNKKGTVSVNEKPLSTFLEDLLRDHQLTHEVVESNFISITHVESVLVRMIVLDEETGERLPFSTARIKGTYQGYISDADGNLEMIVSNPKETTLEVSFVGYVPIEVEAGALRPGELTQISLKRDVQELKEVIIKEYLNKGITTDDQASKVSIDIQEMEILPGLSERDILLSTQILAGIGSADESASGFNVRGSSRDNTFIYWNNIPVYQPAHYFGNISAFIPSAVGSVDIYKNYIPVTYGGSSSGLLVMNSREEITEKPVFESGINLTHVDLYGNIPFANGAGNIMVAGRRSFNDLVATPTFNSISDKLFEGSVTQDVQEGITDGDFDYNSKLVFHDINLAVTLEPSSRNEFNLSMLRSESQLDYNSADEENTARSIQTHNVESTGAGFTWTRRLMDPLSSVLSSSYTDYHMDYALTNFRDEDGEIQNDTEARINNITNFETRIAFNYALAKNHILNAGYQLNHIKANLSINEQFFFEGDFSETTGSEGASHAVFSDYFGKFNSGLQLGAGVRFNGYEAINESRFDTQLRINYEVNKDLLLKSSAGVYHQFISSLKEVDFIFSNTIEQNWITADRDEDIPVIRNRQVVIGALYSKGGWLVDVDGYMKSVNAPVARNFGPQPGDEDGLISGTEDITGIDVTIKKRWKSYRIWAGYAFQDSKITTDVSSGNFTSGLNFRHQLQLSQTLNYKQFEFSTGYTIKSGLPFTNATGFEQVFPANEDPYFEIEYESINSRRLPVYQRVDVSAWYKFRSKKSGFSGEVGISVLNVLNTQNLYSRTFFIEETEEDQQVLLRSDRQLIGITPNMSVKIRF